MTDRSAQFIAVAEEARALAARAGEVDEDLLNALEVAADEVARSWSKSNLGYQANVYYEEFKAPPPGAMFSREWGFLGMFQGTTGDWTAHNVDDVIERIERLAGNPGLDPQANISDEVRPQIEALIERARSLAAKLPGALDPYLTEAVEELQRVSVPSVDRLARMQMSTTSGQFVIRDMQAAEGGWQPSGHQVVRARVLAVRAPYKTAEWLASVCERIGRHIEGEEPGADRAVVQLGSKVFIGHGGNSNEYLKLALWLTKCGLEWEVFTTEPTAGLSTKERLLQMLDNARMAFLVMTPEDESANGAMTARANVIHEVGLFQGRLGWTRAIVLLEEGCEEFSNIEGLGQIRYPKGNLDAALEEIRQVLIREGILAGP